MTKQISCIIINVTLWEEIRVILKDLGYNITMVDTCILKPYNYLYLNYGGIFGRCFNDKRYCIETFNRYLITDKEEFLLKAAELAKIHFKKV